MSRITDYPAKGSPVGTDVVPIVDVEDTSSSPAGTTKKITIGTLPFDAAGAAATAQANAEAASIPLPSPAGIQGQVLTAGVSVPAWADPPVDWFNVANYGATLNGKTVTDGAITATTATLTSNTAGFTSADVGKLIQVRGAGTGSPVTDLNTTISAFTNSTTVTLALAAGTTVTGATTKYGTDDYTAVQAAITAAQAVGGTVYSPAGLSFHGTEYSITGPMRWTGSGSGSIIMSVNCAGINFQNTYISNGSGENTENNGLELDHLIFDVTGGHILYNTNFNGFHWHDLYLVQHSAGYAVWFSNNAAANQLSGLVENVVSFVYGGTRSYPAWYVLSFIGGGMALCEFRRCSFQNQNHDTTQYLVAFKCTGTHNYLNQLSFTDCTFAQANGGCVDIEAGQDIHFQGCGIVDTYTVAAGNSMYRIAMNSGSTWVTANISFKDMSRDLQGPNGSATWDIFLDPANGTVNKVLIENYGIRDIPGVSVFYPYFNLGNATNVVLIGSPDAVISNPASDLIKIGAGSDGIISGPGIAELAGATFTGWTAPAVVALTDAATIAVNAALGNDMRVTLGGNRTLGNPSNPVDGQRIDFMVTQPASGGPYTLAFGAAYLFSSGLPSPTLTTTASYTDVLGFIYNAALGGWLFVGFVPGFS